MKILLELDVEEAVGKDFETMPADYKVRLKEAASQMIRRAALNLRSKKLKSLLEDIRRESGCCNEGCTELDAEILLAILRTEDY